MEPWLPLGHPDGTTVSSQRDVPDSTLHLVRDLIALRRSRSDLCTGTYQSLTTEAPVWAWRRGDRTVVVCNFDDNPRVVDGLAGTVLSGTDRSRLGERVSGGIHLSGWEALVLETEAV